MKKIFTLMTLMTLGGLLTNAQVRQNNNQQDVVENTVTLRGNTRLNTGATEGRARGAYQNPNFDNDAAIYIRIYTGGIRYTVSVGDQSISNANGYYRFFDVPANSRQLITISQRNTVIFRGYANIRRSTRYVLDFDNNDGRLYVLNTQSLGANNQDDLVWNNPWNQYYSGNNNQNWHQNNRYNEDRLPTMSLIAFGGFLNSLSKASFSSTQMNMIRSQAKLTAFTAEQVKAMCKVFSFDSDKLTAAKELYGDCVNPQNYYVVYDVFSFQSSKNDLMQFIQNSGRN